MLAGMDMLQQGCPVQGEEPQLFSGFPLVLKLEEFLDVSFIASCVPEILKNLRFFRNPVHVITCLLFLLCNAYD